MIPVVIPAKPLDLALSRLARVLSPSQRRAVQVAMLTDVIRAGVGFSQRVIIVSADEQVEAMARQWGAQVVPDAVPAEGIDAAVARGLEATPGEAALVVMGDLPLVTGDDLHAVANALGPNVPGIACAISADGTGTNALYLRPPDVVATGFGEGSLTRHVDAAAAAGVAAVAVAVPGLVRDIDTPEDLLALIRSGHECATARVCRELAVADGLVEVAATN